MVHISRSDTYQSMSIQAADAFAEAIKAKPNATILVATGNTPMGMYDELALRSSHGDIDTSQLRPFQLDEYLGCAPDDSRSLYGWMLRSFIEPLGIPDTQVVRLAGETENPEAECQAFERSVEEQGGIDIAILGLGPNGHLGFNEPPSSADAPTRVITLTPESVQSNSAYWGSEEQVPRQAMTAGMSVILAARQIFLLVSGVHKHTILTDTLNHPPTPGIPSTLLKSAHDVTVFADTAALEGDPARSGTNASPQ